MCDRKIWVGAALLLFSISVNVSIVAGQDTGCPCGPPLAPAWVRNALFPQELLGVDIRPSCYWHDDCYATPGTNRLQCDKQFRAMLANHCATSPNPRRCMHLAHGVYFVERTFGWRAFRIRQGKVNPILPITHGKITNSCP